MQLIILASGKGSRLNYKIKVPKIFIKIKNKTLFDLNKKFYSFFKKRIIVLGYGYQNSNKILKNQNFKIIKNDIYYKTNMVHSLFCTKKQINDDVLICYGDIFFDWKIINQIKLKKDHKNLIILKENWLSLWKKRMSLKNIFNDAEDVKVKNKKLISIGEKINEKLPQLQFMGILRLNKKSFFKLSKFYTKIKNYNIDFTSFLNQAIKRKIINVNITKTKKFWFEVDNKRDLKILTKFINDKKII
mgnify:CR=1 FL=1